jgi:hypothetical protein
MRMRLSPIGRMVVGVVIALLVISYILRWAKAGAATPFLFLIAAVIVVAAIVFAATRGLRGRR